MKRRLFPAAFLAAALPLSALMAGCHSAPKPDAASATSASGYKSYHLRGKVISTSPSTSEATIANDNIPGFMSAMTMPYKVKDANILSALHPGDTITADVEVSPDGSDIFLDHIVVVAQARPDYKPTSIYNVPTPGQQVPDFRLRNQDNRLIHLAQFRGKQLLVTFIYTRCPVPNFCPLVTRNFAILNQRIAADPALNGKTHLLSISFDPLNDTPARLRAYGAQYIGSDAKDAFAHWDFAVPDQQVLHKMALYFDVGLTPAPDGTITHTLSTTLIGPSGKVEDFYPGNDWTVDQVFHDVKQSAQHS